MPRSRRSVRAAVHARPVRILAVLSLAAISFALGQTSVIAAIGELIRVFDTDATGVAWTLTAYLISAAVLTPIIGRLGDMLGRRRLLVAVLAVFAIGSVAAALAPSLEVVIAGRVLQGAGGGVYPLCYGIVRDELPRRRVRGAIGQIAATAGVGAALGLVLGGVLTDHASFRWIFWVSGATAAVTALAARAVVPESPPRARAPVDVRGAVLLSIGLVLPLLAISRANAWGWASPRTVLLAAAGLVVLAVWVAVQRRTPVPLIDLRTLRERPVLMTNATTLLTGCGLYGSLLLVAQLAVAPTATGYGLGLSATEAGLLVAPGALAMLGAGPLCAALCEWHGPKLALSVGCLVGSCGLFALALRHGTAIEVMIATVLLLSGVGLSLAAMPNLIVEAVAERQTGEATGVNALMRAAGASLGTQVSATILTASIVAERTLPTDASFRAAFVVNAAVSLVAAVVALRIPTRRVSPERRLSAAEDVGAAAPLPSPPYGRSD